MAEKMPTAELSDEDLRVRVCIARGDIIKHPRGWYRVAHRKDRDALNRPRIARSSKVRLSDAAAMTKPGKHNKNPDYLHDLNASWELEEEPEADDYWLSLSRVEISGRKTWRAWLRCVHGGTREDIVEHADTPARAICEAYLNWKAAQP